MFDVITIGTATRDTFLRSRLFRRIKDPALLKFLPLRLTVMFVISICMATAVLFFFQPQFGLDVEGFKMVATVTLLGLIGACTADLIGKE